MVHRDILLLTACVAVWFGVGCQPSRSPASAPAQSPSPASLSPEELQACKLAKEFLLKRDTNWGEPSQVRREETEVLPGLQGERVYLVIYPTPADELKTLGDRAVVVDLAKGRAEFVPRD